MREHIMLVFKDGIKYDLDTGSLRSLTGILKIQKKLGDPVEVIGDGKGAEHLRQQYKIYNADPKNYKADVVGGVAELSGISVEKAREKLDSVKKKLRLHI